MGPVGETTVEGSGKVTPRHEGESVMPSMVWSRLSPSRSATSGAEERRESTAIAGGRDRDLRQNLLFVFGSDLIIGEVCVLELWLLTSIALQKL
jgi:hypothetical protein